MAHAGTVDAPPVAEILGEGWRHVACASSRTMTRAQVSLLIAMLATAIVACASTVGDRNLADADGDAGTDASFRDGSSGTDGGGDDGDDAGRLHDASPDSSGPTVEPGPPLVFDKSVCPAAYRAAGPAAGTNTGFIVAGQERTFAMALPPPSFAGPRPLFVALHGTGGSGPGFLGAFLSFAAKGFIVVAPTSAGNGSYWPVWDALRLPGTEGAPNKDLELFDALVGCTAAHFAIDKTRVFVGGVSAGGIFTNRILRARSSLVAGGIPASGAFSLTASGTDAPLDDMFVVVTWGGDNDEFTGPAGSPYQVTKFNFAEEAMLASRHYEDAPAVEQVHCRGHELGHAWLPLGDWLIDAFLTHPKGAKAEHGTTPPLPSGLPATCSGEAATVAPLAPSTCGASATNGCQAYCQLTSDCVGANRTLRGPLNGALSSAGLSDGSCADCLASCQSSGGAGKAAALTCFESERAAAQCGPGIEGAMPYMKAVNTCCKNRTDASLCVDLCTSLNASGASASFFPTCKEIAP